MFTRKRSKIIMGDVAQFRKEVEDIVDKAAKDFEKGCEGFKQNEKVKILVQKVLNGAGKIKQDVKKFENKADFNAEQARKEFDQAMSRFANDIKKDVENISENFADIWGKLTGFFEEVSCNVAKRMEDFHVKDETVKIRIEIEKKLSDMTAILENEYKDKELIRQLKKTNESIGKEIGKRLEEFKNDRIDVQNNVRQMLKKISQDFERNIKNDSEISQEIIRKVKKSVNEISVNIGERFDKLKKTVNNLQVSDEVYKIRKDAEKALAGMSSDFKKKVRSMENKDVHFVDELTRTFLEVSEKVRQDVHQTLDTFHEDAEKAKEKVEDLLKKVTSEFQRKVKETGPMQDILNAVEDVSKKAAVEISKTLEGLKKRLEEFANEEKVAKRRRDVEMMVFNIQGEVEVEFHHLKGNGYVNEALAKLNQLHDAADEKINELLLSVNGKKEKVDAEIHEVFKKLNRDFEATLGNIRTNPHINEIILKLNEVTNVVSKNISKTFSAISHGRENVSGIVQESYNSAKNHFVDVSKVTKKSMNEAVSHIGGKAEDSAGEMKNGIDPLLKKQADVMLKSVKGFEYEELPIFERVKKTLCDVFYAGVYLVLFLVQSIPVLLRDCLRVFRPKSLDNKVVLITGTGHGLGKVLAKKFARLGAKVACVDINESANEATGEELRKKVKCQTCVRTFSADISKPESCKKLAEDVLGQFGKVDILINNAGILACHKISEGEDADIQRVIDVNLVSNFWMVRAFLPHMKERKLGQIVFINSQSGIHGLAMASSYAASKAGLLGLAYSLESELRRDPSLEKIKITSVHPMYFSTSDTMDDTVNGSILSVNSVADWTIHGIRRNFFAFTVPMVYCGFVMSTLFRLLPLRIYEHFIRKIGGIKSNTTAYFRNPVLAKKKA